MLPDRLPHSHRHTGLRCLLLAVVACALSCGCSDSQSDEFTEFSNLPQVVPAEPDTESDSTDTTVPQSATIDETEMSESDASVDAPAAVESETPSTDVQTTETRSVPPSTETKPAEDAAADTAAKPNPIQLLIPHKRFRTEGNALRASFDDIDLLKALNMDPVPLDAADYFPDWLNNLNGRRVRVRGYMRPGYLIEDITEFLFVRDNGECCYGPLPKIYDMIAVTLADGESTDLIEGTPFDVEGTMRIESHSDEVELYGLFFIDDGVIIE